MSDGPKPRSRARPIVPPSPSAAAGSIRVDSGLGAVALNSADVEQDRVVLSCRYSNRTELREALKRLSSTTVDPRDSSVTA